MSTVRRILVEKQPGFAVEARGIFRDLKENLGISGLQSVRVIHRYDMEGIDWEAYERGRWVVFAERPVDTVWDDELVLSPSARVLAIELLPGQYDQRADSAAQCLQILTQGEKPEIRVARLLVLEGSLSDAEFQKIREYMVNPLESQEASLSLPATLEMAIQAPPPVQVLEGFQGLAAGELEALRQDLGLAMSPADLAFCQAYFRDTERRNPFLTEIRVLDTYWSDHCRHTTFLSRIEEAQIESSPFLNPLRKAQQDYLRVRQEIYGARSRDISLMDIATLAMKEARHKGLLEDLDASEEINACSIRVEANLDGEKVPWLVMFKNETHNHPTEIEPFGGAATCLGGAIRDPLSGRSYVYSAMRVTGSGDPRIPVEKTLPGKLPQSTITRGAAAGFSSYGNQIGLATGQVVEIYDPGYIAKRMEIGAVVGAAPLAQVARKRPQPGDLVLLLGGRTGRDGCGGATGSSKAHTEESLLTCGAEVQKGNPPTERKLQRLFRIPEISRLIKRCNDFGAGGVSVAIGELTDGLDINLDAVPKKYEGLDGTELAISESQERMAVVIAPEDLEAFLAGVAAENLEATVVATVTAEPRLKMHWRGQTLVDLSREFLNTNGVSQTARVRVLAPAPETNFFPARASRFARKGWKEAWLETLEQLESCSQKGLVERFDSTIGAGSVLLPFGGKCQLTPAEGMAAKLPVVEGETSTATLMTFGYHPPIARWSPFHGAVYAIVEAVAKIAALGGDYRRVRLTLQEYFEKPGQNPVAWGKPYAALLGAFQAQRELGIAAIGGKDSMSGTFRDLTVPPTLVAFALCPAEASRVLSPEFKQAGSPVVLFRVSRDEAEMPDWKRLRDVCEFAHDLGSTGQVLAAQSLRAGGIAEAITKMCLGNWLGFQFDPSFEPDALWRPDYGSLLLELRPEVDLNALASRLPLEKVGTTQPSPQILFKEIVLPLEEALAHWTRPLERTFPSQVATPGEPPVCYSYPVRGRRSRTLHIAKPRIFLPVFPGTNCEVDTARAFQRAGGIVDSLVFRNLTPEDLGESLRLIARKIGNTQIIMLPGGFSAGDEPEGSGKFIGAVFRNPRIKEAVHQFLKERDGLMLGICNGFQALIKLGLVPYGEIRELDPDTPTLTYNTIGRHVSCMVRTRVASTLSPWLWKRQVDDIHTIAISHGEGRFVAEPYWLEHLGKKGQIATQYVDGEGNPTLDSRFNPNGSAAAIEGITSPDGRVFGKMGHSERIGLFVAQNVPGEKDQEIFEAGVEYFQ